MHDHATGILVTGAGFFHEDVHRARIVGRGGPLDDIIMVLAPVEFADIETVGARVAIVREPWRGTEVQVPVQAFGHWFGGAEPLRPENRPAIAVGVDGLQLPDAATADEFAGNAELAAVFAALLSAGLIDAAVAPDSGQHGLTFGDRHGTGFLAIDVLAGSRGHGGHGSVPVSRGGDEDGINIGPVQDMAKIGIGFAGLVVGVAGGFGVVIVDLLAGLLTPVTPDIADGQDLNVLSARVAARNVGPGAAQQVAAALAPDADEPHRDALAGRDESIPAES